jgi:hypothetical protein
MSNLPNSLVDSWNHYFTMTPEKTKIVIQGINKHEAILKSNLRGKSPSQVKSSQSHDLTFFFKFPFGE